MRLLFRLANSSSSFIVPQSATILASPAFSFPTAILDRIHPETLQHRHFNSRATMAASDAALRAFFQAPKYAVVGASTNTEKYGFKGTFSRSSGPPFSRARTGDEPHPTLLCGSEFGDAVQGLDLHMPTHRAVHPR